MADLVHALRESDPQLRVIDDPELLVSYQHDQAPGQAYGMPTAVALPETTEQVVGAVRVAARLGVPIVARGAGTGLAGAANAADGCLVVSTRRLNRIVSIDVDERLAVVQPGVVNADLRAAVAAHGLFYPPDPGSYEECTIGGNVATNAGGMCCLKYGVTSDYVRALEVVLADGSVARPGHRTVKGVAGYDLVGLLTGSEGTLGIVTEVTLALRPAPPEPRTVVAEFASLADAAAAVASVRASRLAPSLLELLDAVTLRAIESWQPLGIGPDAATMLLAQVDGVNADAEAALLGETFRSAGAGEVVRADDAEESALLMQARRLAYPSLERMGTTLLDDVAVPIPQLREFVAGVRELADTSTLTVGVFGHAGDGNMHPTVVYDGTDETQQAEAFGLFDSIVDLALRLGGTVSGEHGIGLLKRGWLERELDDATRGMHRAIKAALDPYGLLNPGTAIPKM